MSNVTPPADGVLTRALEWLSEGAQLRDGLQAERKRLLSVREETQRRLDEIERVLAALPVVSEPSESRTEPARPAFSVAASPVGASAPEVVEFVLRRQEGRLIAANAIVEQVRNLRPEIQPELVHSAIYRLAKAHRIHVEGTKGKRLYGEKRGGEDANPDQRSMAV